MEGMGLRKSEDLHPEGEVPYIVMLTILYDSRHSIISGTKSKPCTETYNERTHTGTISVRIDDNETRVECWCATNTIMK